MSAKKYNVSWTDVLGLVRLAGPRQVPVYGVPRGGAVIAAMLAGDPNLCTPVDDPKKAAWIVDDVIDSGATRARYREEFPGTPFWAPYDKTGEDSDLRGRWIVFPWEPQGVADLEDTVRRQLEWIGEDPTREGLVRTPSRVLRALQEMTQGYAKDPGELLGTVFAEYCDEMVVVREIPFVSLCEHHLMPFEGTATVGYVPAQIQPPIATDRSAVVEIKHRVVGLSKVARLVQAYAQRLQVQERLTQEIANALMDHLRPLGAGVVIEARHSCMALRGPRAPASMTTSALLGCFHDDPACRSEFLALARD